MNPPFVYFLWAVLLSERGVVSSEQRGSLPRTGRKGLVY